MEKAAATTAGLLIAAGAFLMLWLTGGWNTDVYVGMGIGAFVFIAITTAVLMERTQ